MCKVHAVANHIFFIRRQCWPHNLEINVKKSFLTHSIFGIKKILKFLDQFCLFIISYKTNTYSQMQVAQQEQAISNLKTNGNEQACQAQSLHNQVNQLFRTMIQDIKDNQKKMHPYLNKIQLITQEIYASFEKILESNRSLLMKAKQHEIAYQTVKTYFQFLLAFIKSKNTQKLDVKGRIVWYLQIEVKLQCSLQFIHCLKLQKDITNSPQQDYKNVWARIRIDKASNVKKIKKEYKEIKKILHVATSAALNSEQHNLGLFKTVSFGLSFPRYLIMNDSAKLRSFLFYRTPTIELAKKIWNMTEEGAMKEFSKLSYEGIKTNLKIYIPFDGKFDKNVNIFQQRENTITVRVLYNKKLVKFPEFQKSGCQQAKDFEFINKIMVHMHGGGFIALSSRSTQNHTRKWAKELNIPIFSIDYRMPPEHPFPQPPLDCFIVYQFILKYIKYYLNVDPTETYLSGDSAGGNLCCALTALILKNKSLVPKGMYLAYPATDMRFLFTNSKLYSITDPLLWPPMLLLCLNSYMNKNFNNSTNPLATPILLTQEYINGTIGDKRFPLAWPRTIVVVGNRDPLYDDSLLLMQKMVESNIDCECVIYDQLSHGFLSTDLLVAQCVKTVSQSILLLKKLTNVS